jgi:hypothetical protein
MEVLFTDGFDIPDSPHGAGARARDVKAKHVSLIARAEGSGFIEAVRFEFK